MSTTYSAHTTGVRLVQRSDRALALAGALTAGASAGVQVNGSREREPPEWLNAYATDDILCAPSP